ncbi:MAG: hypothetical protein LQ340_002564 [Diploschistes diacapsis]|nr:MAG: hypothetical protein LQ340_002564 [Diploschistes diacapsis]
MLRKEPQQALEHVRSKFQVFRLPDPLLDAIANHYSSVPEQQLLSCLLHFEGADEISMQQHHPYLSGFAISSAYFFGGFIPLLPYIFASTVQMAFYFSTAITAIVLFAFGSIKTVIVGTEGPIKCLKGGFEMLMLGGVAAAAAVLCIWILK